MRDDAKHIMNNITLLKNWLGSKTGEKAEISTENDLLSWIR